MPSPDRVTAGGPGLYFAALLTAVMLSLQACAPGSGEGLDENGRPPGDGPPAMPPAATLDAIQANVFTPSCAIPGCHTGAAAPLGLRLDPDSSFALLVGIPSVEVPSLLRVEPGNPDRSYLIRKLEGTASVGGRMPLNGPPFLDQPTIDLIRQWIIDGALPPASPASLQVMASQPRQGTEIRSLSAPITLIMSDELDPSLLSAVTVRLRRSGGDGEFDDNNDIPLIPAELRVAARNPRVLLIDPGDAALPGDLYELLLVGDGATVLASPTGRLLDGDGNGIPGGDFILRFRIRRE